MFDEDQTKQNACHDREDGSSKGSGWPCVAVANKGIQVDQRGCADPSEMKRSRNA